jgi:hypothetical protein
VNAIVHAAPRDRGREQVEDLTVRPELREVLEREVDRSAHGAVLAERTELIHLSLSAGHATQDSLKGGY